MIAFPTLERPVAVAPMAGGPSTPELVAAVCAAGGTGFLAAGYRSPEDVLRQIERTRELTDRPFGVNVFVPAPLDERPGMSARQAVLRYGDRLAPLARQLQVDLPTVDWDDVDAYDDKVTALVESRIPLASFTFGVPDGDVVERLHGVGCCVIVTVTDPDEATRAARGGADALVVQGYAAGGHRGTHAVQTIPFDREWAEILRETRTVTSLPVLVAGGVMGSRETRLALDAGAVAVQCGTAFLLADEAGTSAAHRAGLREPSLDHSIVTRAFSGRPARGVRNEFVDRYGEAAPPVYPAVNQLTAPLRAAAARLEDPQGVALWAGSGWASARSGPAADIVARLTG
ncbi:nitronate monooxygenase family protein [Allobranchiibius sp. CTAmp26]|uniref:NAD(P)H-dependent flavin oxidoreductase n=1 Tax=Allobranchiibius sp. CTAmp26 TaxID=2815214 RepID=UPI001AA108AC|nr:nitronate monooxygenase [Allobranchiibius sp. CTAmp26]MBO1754752.1 nitronate monooxygenase [Allobranchiibius sp. CTAmp26]